MSKKADHKALIAEIASRSAASPTCALPWYRRHYAAHGETIKAIHDAWHAGELGDRPTTTSRIISEKLASLGIKVGTDGVRRWLNKNPGQW